VTTFEKNDDSRQSYVIIGGTLIDRQNVHAD
jgi:hypothetical protein